MDTDWMSGSDFLLLEAGYSPLMIASQGEHYGVVSSIITEGADANFRGPKGETPLLLAVRHAHKNMEAAIQIVALLVEHGANVNAATNDGETCVTRAAVLNYPKLLRYLVDNGGDVNSTSTGGDTPISYVESFAVHRGKRKQVLKILEDAGGIRKGPSVTDKSSDT